MRALVVEDEPAARAKLRWLLSVHADLQSVHEAPDAPAAMDLVAQAYDDVLTKGPHLLPAGGYGSFWSTI